MTTADGYIGSDEGKIQAVMSETEEILGSFLPI
jgi:hypothetical protein